MSIPAMKTIAVENAVGTVLCHDITRIVPGADKGPVFRKGHQVQPEDIDVLLKVGKEHLFVYEPKPGMLHEDEAAERLAAVITGSNLRLSSPQEGRINLSAVRQGLLQVDVERLTRINSVGEIAFATLHSLQEVAPDQPVAGIRVIPLLVDEARVTAVEELCRDAPVLSVRPFRTAKVGMVTTGSEIYHGRIKDAFGPVVRDKFERLGSALLGQRFTSDDVPMTRDAITNFIAQGADMVVVTGGMSVDPDDRTPASIRAAGGVVERYGAPTFPGAMFLLAFIGTVPVLGLPGCVMYYKTSIFDLIVPRLLAGLTVSSQDIAALGHGGFCAGCSPCRYPICPFGK